MPTRVGVAGPLTAPQPGEVAGVWPWSISRNQSGELTVGSHRLSDLTDRYGSSFRILDLDDMVARASASSFAWAEEFWDGYGFAGVDISFPVKLCQIPQALSALVGLGFTLRITSGEEIALLERSNISLNHACFEVGDSNYPSAVQFISAGGAILVFSGIDNIGALTGLLSSSHSGMKLIWQVSVSDLSALCRDTNFFLERLRDLKAGGCEVSVGLEVDCSDLSVDFVHDFSGTKDLLMDLSKLYQTCLANNLGLSTIGLVLDGQIHKYRGNRVVTEPASLARDLANTLRQTSQLMGHEPPRFSICMGPWFVSPSIFAVSTVERAAKGVTENKVAQAELKLSDFRVFPKFWYSSEAGFRYRALVVGNRVGSALSARFTCPDYLAEDSFLIAPEDVCAGDLLVCPLAEFDNVNPPSDSVVNLFLWHGQIQSRG